MEDQKLQQVMEITRETVSRAKDEYDRIELIRLTARITGRSEKVIKRKYGNLSTDALWSLCEAQAIHNQKALARYKQTNKRLLKEIDTWRQFDACFNVGTAGNRR